MRLSEIVEKVSELYRSERSSLINVREEHIEVTKKLLAADHDGGKNITYDEYQRLKARRIALRQLMNETEKYCEGISAVRELLMDLGFETEVT